MTIFRVQHNKNYSVINNTNVKDKRLSWKAKGIWTYAFSRPDDWEFNIEDLVNQSTDKIDKVNSGLKELEEAGYLERSRIRNPDGTLGKSDWCFHETPREIQKIIPKRENPILDKPILENPVLVPPGELPREKASLLNTDIQLSTEREQQQPAATVAVFSCLKNENRLTKSDIDWLMKFTEAEVEEALKYTQEEADQAKIKTTFSQTIKWAVKEKPKRTPKVDTQENKSIAHAFEDQWVSPYYRLDCCGNSAMIIAVTAQMEPKVISYEEPDFTNKLKSLLLKMGFTPRDFS